MSVWMQVVSGRSIDLLNPDVSLIDINDIAHALSKLCRFTGHTVGDHIYSVAQHSCVVAAMLPDHLKLRGLLHDAHEAYIGDISSPVKELLGEPMKRLDAAWMAAIATRFGFSTEPDGSVKYADLTALAHEHMSIMARSDRPWFYEGKMQYPAYDITPWPIAKAREEFLLAYNVYKDLV